MNILSILPCVEFKFKSQYYNPINRLYLVHASFGANAENILKLFKILFAVQDSMVNVPLRKQTPNHKVEHFFSRLIQVSTEAFEPGRNLSFDKKYASFQ